ncbi:MAG: superoxide dismutase [Cyanothece sp. SIO1E1]|nr:superoxide dismutase [Cyanothece sp. SIO1E1]
MSPGFHGFHIHANPDCGPGEKEGKIVPGLAAGGHFDPFEAGYHDGPYGDGHLGDLSLLFVAEDGRATMPVLAPRLEVAYVANRFLMVHLNGDNYSDVPKPLGVGSARLACGVIASE